MPNGADSILKTALLDLLYELRDSDVSLVLGGGYGLYLKQIYLEENRQRTILDASHWPPPRATQDLDFFLQTELVVDRKRFELLRKALDQLGYVPIPEAEFYQFVKTINTHQSVKIDLLTGPSADFRGDERIKINDRRVRPRGRGIRLHSHPTDEALALEVEPLEIFVEGDLSTGDNFHSKVYVPQPFTFILMKLFAFRDRKDDANKDFGQHHASDLYRIVAMMTEKEYDAAKQFVKGYNEHSVLVEARRIISEHFQSADSIGIIRIKEYSKEYSSDISAGNIERFISVFKELFW